MIDSVALTELDFILVDLDPGLRGTYSPLAAGLFAYGSFRASAPSGLFSVYGENKPFFCFSAQITEKNTVFEKLWDSSELKWVFVPLLKHSL